MKTNFPSPAQTLREALRKRGETPGRGRPAALRLLAGFFLLMLLFTLLSRAADGMTIAQVQTATPAGGVLTHKVEVSGQVEAAGQLSLSAPEGALLSELKVRKGDQVQKGAALAVFDPQELELLRAKRRSELETLRAEWNASGTSDTALEQAQRTLERLREDLSSGQKLAQEAIDRAQEALEEAHRSYDRLYKEHEGYLDESYRSYHNTINDADNEPLIPEWDDSDRHKAWAADAKAARAEMESARETIGSREDALQAAIREKEKERREGERAISDQEAAVETAARSLRESGGQAAARRGELALSIREKEKALGELDALMENGCTLTAPANGLVLSVKGEAGGRAPDGELIGLSADGAGSRVVVKATKDQMKWLAVGDGAKVNLTVDGRRKSIDAKLSSIGLDTPDPDGGERYRLELALPEGSYLAGESADVTIEKPSEQYYTTLPLTALRTENGENCVYVLREKDTVLGREWTVERVSVTVNDQDQSRMAVEGALAGDEKVVTSATRTLSTGDRVRVRPD